MSDFDGFATGGPVRADGSLLRWQADAVHFLRDNGVPVPPQPWWTSAEAAVLLDVLDGDLPSAVDTLRFFHPDELRELRQAALQLPGLIEQVQTERGD